MSTNRDPYSGKLHPLGCSFGYKTKKWLGKFGIIWTLKSLNINLKCLINDRILKIGSINWKFFLFSKHSLQVRFRSSVQILRKLLVCIEGIDSLQTNNFHLRWLQAYLWHLEAYLGHLEVHLGHLGAHLGHLEAHLGHLDANFKFLEAHLGHLRAQYARPRTAQRAFRVV